MDEIKWHVHVNLFRRLCAAGSWFFGALCASAVVFAVLCAFSRGIMADIVFAAKLCGLLCAGAWVAIFIATLIRHITKGKLSLTYSVTDSTVRVAMHAKRVKVIGIPVTQVKHVWLRPYGVKLSTHHHNAQLFCDRATAHRVRHFLKSEMN